MNPSQKYSRWKLSKKAEHDIEEIAGYSEARWGLAQRDRYLDLLRDTFDAFLEQPLSGIDYSYLKSRYRRAAVGQHYIFYRLNDDVAEILRIIHKKRDIVRHLDDDSDDDDIL